MILFWNIKVVQASVARPKLVKKMYFIYSLRHTEPIATKSIGGKRTLNIPVSGQESKCLIDTCLDRKICDLFIIMEANNFIVINDK